MDIINLFGDKEHIIKPAKSVKQTLLFDDYEGFIEKFKPKLTTDDCYTPPAVFDCVLNYVRETCDIDGCEVVRPFYPGGDYESYDYPADCIVIDNPPFSIISKIAKFYITRGIKFFLFAPHLTLFAADIDCTRIVAGAKITYENGAVVLTSFLSNMFGDIGVIGEPRLYQAIKRINAANAVSLPKYVYPDHVLTVSAINWCIERGVGMKFDKSALQHISRLASQKPHGKAIFGSGFLMSDKAAAEKAAAEKAAAEKAAAEKAAAEKDHVIVWELSDIENKIIEQLK